LEKREGTTIHIDGNYEGGWKELYQRAHQISNKKKKLLMIV